MAKSVIEILPSTVNKEDIKLQHTIEENISWVNEVFNRIDAKLQKITVKSRNKLPYSCINGVHDNRGGDEPDWWTNGFWPGLNWLMYSETGNDEYKTTALNGEKLLDKAFEDFTKLHHDVGFMWHLSSGANYRLTGDKKAYNKTLYAAAMLASRYNIDGKYIRAWNHDCIGWTIIDTMMNIPLLHWASKELDDPRFKRIAISHADMAIHDHINPDGSSNHIVVHDIDTGKVIRVQSGQGYNCEGSCWTRGLSWAVYGMVLSYIHTSKQEYLDAAIKTADYFIENSKKYNYKTPIDFKQPEEPAYYDSTAGVITACGLIEIAKAVPDGKKYITAAINILRATDEFFCDYTDENDAVVLMGSEFYPRDGMFPVHIPIIYGDFFFIEALLKLKGSKFLIW